MDPILAIATTKPKARFRVSVRNILSPEPNASSSSKPRIRLSILRKQGHLSDLIFFPGKSLPVPVLFCFKRQQILQTRYYTMPPFCRTCRLGTRPECSGNYIWRVIEMNGKCLLGKTRGVGESNQV